MLQSGARLGRVFGTITRRTIRLIYFQFLCYITKPSLSLYTTFTGSWYLSADGNDTVLCGRNEFTACRTLTWLLTIAKKELQFAAVQIVTNTDLIFNRSIVVKL